MNRAGLLLIALMGAVLILATACGGQADTLTSIPTPTFTPTPTPPTPPVPKPGCEEPTLEISVNGEGLQFDQDKLQVAAGTEVVLCFKNVASLNHHNWVLVQDGTKDKVAKLGLEAGPDDAWVQPGDPNVVGHTRLVKPGEEGEVRFGAPPTGTYQFVCTFPGHNFTMFGDFVVTP